MGTCEGTLKHPQKSLLYPETQTPPLRDLLFRSSRLGRFYNGILQVVMRVPLMGYYASIRVTISVVFGAPIGVVMSTRRV